VAGRNQGRGLLELLCSVGVAQQRQCNVAPPGEQFRRIPGVTILGFLGFLLEFVRLAEGRKLGLLGLIEQAVCLG